MEAATTTQTIAADADPAVMAAPRADALDDELLSAEPIALALARTTPVQVVLNWTPLNLSNPRTHL